MYISVWQARNRVSVFAANASYEGAVAAAQKYADDLNAQNSAYHLHRADPQAAHQRACWRDHEGMHLIFIMQKEMLP